MAYVEFLWSYKEIFAGAIAFAALFSYTLRRAVHKTAGHKPSWVNAFLRLCVTYISFLLIFFFLTQKAINHHLATCSYEGCGFGLIILQLLIVPSLLVGIVLWHLVFDKILVKSKGSGKRTRLQKASIFWIPGFALIAYYLYLMGTVEGQREPLPDRYVDKSWGCQMRIQPLMEMLKSRGSRLEAARAEEVYPGSRKVDLEIADCTLENIKWNIAKGADVNMQVIPTMTPLLVAAKFGDVESVRLLITSGANVNAVGQSGWTPLIYASRNGHTDVVKELIEKGASLNVRDWSDESALKKAKEKGHLDIVKILEEADATD